MLVTLDWYLKKQNDLEALVVKVKEHSEKSGIIPVTTSTAIDRMVMEALEKIFKCCDMSASTKIRIVQAMVFSVTLYRSRGSTLKKQNRKSTDTF